jgi:hypothetical protein
MIVLPEAPLIVSVVPSRDALRAFRTMSDGTTSGWACPIDFSSCL